MRQLLIFGVKIIGTNAISHGDQPMKCFTLRILATDAFTQLYNGWAEFFPPEVELDQVLCWWNF